MSSSVPEIQNSDMESKTLGNGTPSEASTPSIDGKKIPEEKVPDSSEQQLKVSNNAEEGGGAEEEEEEEGECGFCVFMKGGGCRESFIAWEKCVEDAEKNKENVVDKCYEVTGLLKACMDRHSDYYSPILQAEKAAEQEAVKELERQNASSSSSDAPDKKDAPIDKEQQGASLDSKND